MKARVHKWQSISFLYEISVTNFKWNFTELIVVDPQIQVTDNVGGNVNICAFRQLHKAHAAEYKAANPD